MKAERKLRKMLAVLIKDDPPESPWVQSAQGVMTLILAALDPKRGPARMWTPGGRRKKDAGHRRERK